MNQDMEMTMDVQQKESQSIRSELEMTKNLLGEKQKEVRDLAAKVSYWRI